MKKKNRNIVSLTSLITLIIILSGALLFMFEVEASNSFALAKIKCGHDPIIGSNGIYYSPGPSNQNMSYELLSLYNPSALNLADYPKAKFFCSAAQAQRAGYHLHECCGLYSGPFNEQ